MKRVSRVQNIMYFMNFISKTTDIYVCNIYFRRMPYLTVIVTDA